MKQVPKQTPTKRVPGRRSAGPKATIDLLHAGLRQSAVHVNLGQNMIVLTEDRLRLDLSELSASTKHRQEWQAPAGMLTSEVAAFITSRFHETIGISGQQWESLFLALIVLTFFWLLAALIRGRRATSADALIEKLKSGQPRTDRNQTKG
jgi:hypothetical protein